MSHGFQPWRGERREERGREREAQRGKQKATSQNPQLAVPITSLHTTYTSHMSQKTVEGVAGDLKGRAAGAATGAVAGAVVAGPVGAVAGGLLGQTVGAIVGAEAGSEAGPAVEVMHSSSPGEAAAQIADDGVKEQPEVGPTKA